MSFSKIIILSVISVYLFFSIILFGIFNSFYIKNTKEKLKGENAFSKKVAMEFLEKEKDVLLKQATQIGQTPYVYVALWTNKLLAVRDVRLISDEQDRLEIIQAQVMNPLKYMKLVNEESEKLYGSNISEVEKRGLAFYTKFGGKELKKAASSRSYPSKFIDTGKESYLVDAVGWVGRPGTDIKFVQSIGDEFYLKSIHNPNKTRGFGVVVNGRELGIEVLKDIKNVVNKEVFLVKDDKIVCSTLFSDVKTKKRIKVDKEKLYGEYVLLNKNIGINFFPLYDYEKSVVGYVGVGFYLEEVNRIYYESLYKFIIFSICFSAIIFAILFLIVSKLFRPFGEIINGIKIVEKGEYNKKIVIKSYGELKLLSESINSLSEAVEIREKQLKKQNEELLELDKMKDYFLANTSHELKTPLNGIMGIAESLIIADSERFSKDMIKKISMIVLSAKRLGNLVNDILDFSKMRNKKLTIRFDKVNLKNVSENVISLILPMLNGKKITMINNISEDIFVSGDENKIQQIFYNLIGNAIKFTDSGTITLKAQVINNMVEMRVIDTGLGIAKENFDKIFKSFEQVDGTDTRKYGGIGLGLSITKDLVELHGGTIVVDSEIDKGSSFIFTLKREEWVGEVPGEKKIKNPIFSFDNNMFESEEQEKSNFAKGKILIVDDEPVNLVVLNDYLVLKGYEVISASNGEDALKIINKNIGIELVILDVMMPKMSGYEVCKILRESYSSYSLPVLMVTAKGRTEDIVAGFESGANDYLTKPVEAKELYARVGTLIALRDAVNSSIELEVKYEREKREKEFAEKMKKQTEENLIKIGVIDKLIMSVAIEKNKDKLIKLFNRLLILAESDKYKKVSYFDYYEDSGSFVLNDSVTNDIEVKVNFGKIEEKDYLGFVENIIKSTESVKKEAIRIKIDEFAELLEAFYEIKPKFIRKLESGETKMAKMENILFYPLHKGGNIFGGLILELVSEEGSLINMDMLDIFCKNIEVYFEKRELSEINLKNNIPLNYRCEKCNNKLLEYKGEIDYVSIKCRRCDHINEINRT